MVERRDCILVGGDEDESVRSMMERRDGILVVCGGGGGDKDESIRWRIERRDGRLLGGEPRGGLLMGTSGGVSSTHEPWRWRRDPCLERPPDGPILLLLVDLTRGDDRGLVLVVRKGLDMWVIAISLYESGDRFQPRERSDLERPKFNLELVRLSRGSVCSEDRDKDSSSRASSKETTFS